MLHHSTIAGMDADFTALNMDAHGHAWSIDLVADALEDTNWGWTTPDVGWRSYIPGLKGWSGSVECYADSVPATLVVGMTITDAQFYVDKANARGYKGDIVVTGEHPGVTIEGIETLTFDFQGSGSLARGVI